MKFQTTTRPLRKLVQEFSAGTILLPQFQRNFVWRPSKIRNLLDSRWPRPGTGEPGAGNRPAGFGERGEETCPWESDCGPAAKAPDEPPTPYRLCASPRLYSNLGGTPSWSTSTSLPPRRTSGNASRLGACSDSRDRAAAARASAETPPPRPGSPPSAPELSASAPGAV